MKKFVRFTGLDVSDTHNNPKPTTHPHRPQPPSFVKVDNIFPLSWLTYLQCLHEKDENFSMRLNEYKITHFVIVNAHQDLERRAVYEVDRETFERLASILMDGKNDKPINPDEEQTINNSIDDLEIE